MHCANEMGGLANAIIIVEQIERTKLKLNNLNSIKLHPRPSSFARSVGELEDAKNVGCLSSLLIHKTNYTQKPLELSLGGKLSFRAQNS